MFIEKKDTKIIFNYRDKAYAIMDIDSLNSEIRLNILRVSNPFRNMGIATFVMKEILNYISKFFNSIKKITLSPLPLDTNGLNHQQLISFYKKFGFKLCQSNDISTPYLMSKDIF